MFQQLSYYRTPRCQAWSLRYLTDVAFDFILGALIIASSRALAQGEMLAVWLYGSSLLIDSFYSLVMGYPLNYILMGLVLLLIWQMIKYRAELELS